MEDYPVTLAAFESRFGTEEACRDFLFALRWPQGFRCPRCEGAKSWPVNDTLFQCAACGYQASVIAGTIFQDTHKPLTTWFRAAWWLTNQKTGASALGLQRLLGLGSYQTAWTWLHKFRRAMVRPGRDRLGGRIEVDETYIGGWEEGRRGRPGAQSKKALVVIAAQEDGNGIGRIRMRRLASASAESLLAFIGDVIEPGSCIHTDGWNSYSTLKDKGYVHQADKERGEDTLLPRVHRVASLLKRWLLGTHQGAVSHLHLEYYLDEFTFRFNRRTSQHRGKLFYRLLQQAVAVDPVPYSTLILNVRGQRKARHNL
jgi:transposase-like protein